MQPVAILFRSLIVASLAAAMLSPARAQGAGEPVSFAGKQIKLLIGFSPTGYGYDTYGRLLARHLTRHLPGHPTIVVFFYTRCDNPLKCTLTITKLGQMQRALEARGRQNWRRVG